MGVLDILILAVLLVGSREGRHGRFLPSDGFHGGVLCRPAVGFFMLYYSALGEWLALLWGRRDFQEALAFVLIWLGIPAALSFVAFVLTKAARRYNSGRLEPFGGALLGG